MGGTFILGVEGEWASTERGGGGATSRNRFGWQQDAEGGRVSPGRVREETEKKKLEHAKSRGNAFPMHVLTETPHRGGEEHGSKRNQRKNLAKDQDENAADLQHTSKRGGEIFENSRRKGRS